MYNKLKLNTFDKIMLFVVMVFDFVFISNAMYVETILDCIKVLGNVYEN